jgi:hypothetical protein
MTRTYKSNYENDLEKDNASVFNANKYATIAEKQVEINKH